jgi:hypothetical protein
MNDDRETKRMYCELLEADLSIDLEKDLSPPPVAITFGTHEYKTSKGTIIEETPMATYGNFSFIQAPPKSYKSYFVSLLASVYLKSENKWAGEKFKSYSNGKRLLHFDTEQGAWHCQRGARRIAEMAGTSDKYESYALRTIPYKERMDFIDYKIMLELLAQRHNEWVAMARAVGCPEPYAEDVVQEIYIKLRWRRRLIYL